MADDDVRDVPTLSNPVPPHEVDNRLLDEVEEKDLSRMVENDDYNLAQRMQEREVMGHSRTLYDEQVARDMANDEKYEETGEASLPQHQPCEDRDESVSSKMLREGDEDEEEEEGEGEEGHEVLKKRLQKTRDEAKRLVKRIEELDEESKSLKLAIELQKKDVAASHQALWKKSSRVTNRSHSMSTEDSQFAHEHVGDNYTEVDDEQPRPKTPPHSSDCVPCQWCSKLIPFEQVMLHQVSQGRCCTMTLRYLIVFLAPSNHAMMTTTRTVGHMTVGSMAMYMVFTLLMTRFVELRMKKRICKVYYVE